MTTMRLVLVALIAAVWAPGWAHAQSVSAGTEELANEAFSAVETAATDVALDSDAIHEPLDEEKDATNIVEEIATSVSDEVVLPNGARIYIGLKGKDAVSGTEAKVALTVGAAELTAAYLLRNSSVVATKIGSRAEATATSRILTPRGTPMRMPNVRVPGRFGRFGTKVLRKLGPVGRIAAVVANFSVLKALPRGQRLAALARRMGTFGRFTTRQVLYVHGAYNVLVGTTGRDIEVGWQMDFGEQDVLEPPSAGSDEMETPEESPPERTIEGRTIDKEDGPTSPISSAENVSEGVDALCGVEGGGCSS